MQYLRGQSSRLDAMWWMILNGVRLSTPSCAPEYASTQYPKQCSQMLGAMRILSGVEGSIYPGLHPHQLSASGLLDIVTQVECMEIA